MAGNDGTSNVPLDPSDQAAYNATWQTPTSGPGFMSGIADVVTKMGQTANLQNAANLKAQLAQEIGTHSKMRVDPDQVDSLAKFFEDEAQSLADHLADSQQLASVPPPGGDPISTQAATAYGNVASGGPEAYLNNVTKLQQVFHSTAANLRASAQQSRSSDEDAASGLKGGNLA